MMMHDMETLLAVNVSLFLCRHLVKIFTSRYSTSHKEWNFCRKIPKAISLLKITGISGSNL